MDEGRNKFIDILLMLTISFFSAFSIGLNKYAVSIDKDDKMSRLLLISEILIHGLSGLFIGLIFTKFISDIYILCAMSGIGGMLGQKLLYNVAKNFMAAVMSLDEKQREELINEDDPDDNHEDEPF